MKSYDKTKQKFIGKTFKSNNYGDFVVVDYIDCNNVLIIFKNTDTTAVTTTTLIKRGSVRDPSLKKASGEKREPRCKYVGNVYTSNNYGDYYVESIVDQENVRIRFINTDHQQEVNKAQIRNGAIRDYSAEVVSKSRTNNVICKVGNRGEDKNLIRDNLKVYHVWNAMLQRCYNPRTEYIRRNYKDCQVSEPFKHFPTFLNWWKLQSTDENVEYQLDKDILVKGNRLYSEDTCVLVPRDINMLLIKRDKARGELPIGVTYCKKNKKYKAQFSKYNVITALGLFDKVIDAFLAYKQAKEAYIKEVANKYKNVIDIRVYDVLMKYEVSIDD